MTTTARSEDALHGLEPVSNGAKTSIALTMPYLVEVTIKGVAPILFHRWNVEAVEEKAKAKKGSATKKSDDIESYVYRNEAGNLSLPGEYLRQSIIVAAKFRQDPRSPRKSAMDLFKAAVVSLTELADLGTKAWDYVDQRRVTIQRNGITRRRPALGAGWTATFRLMVNLPEYVAPQDLNEVIQAAGRLIGLADFRPTYGRFQVIKFDVVEG